MKITNKIFKILLLTSLFFAFTITLTAETVFDGLGRPDERVPLNRQALTGTLPNGLKYYILENSFPENRAYLALVVNAGSVLERDDQRGFAHFVEHLAFNGTERFPDLEIIDYLRSLGSRFGANLNAYTSYNETVYHFDIPVEVVDGVKRIPERALAILDDWSYAVSFSKEQVDSERRVILEEIRTRLGAMERARKIIFPILFHDSAYADRDVIGLAHIIEDATAGQLREFYEHWYSSDNIALIFVGDFDGKILEAELSSHFNMNARAQIRNRPRHELPPPVYGNFQVEIITDPELTAASYNIYYKMDPGAQKGTISNYREIVIDYLISDMLSFRFQETAMDPQSASIGSWGGIWRWASNSRFYSMGTQPKTGNAGEALMELLLEIESIRRFGFTESELHRAKLRLVSYMEKQLSEKDRMESRNFIRGFTNHFLYGESMTDIEWEVDAINSLLGEIGISEIVQTARSYFADNDISVFLLAPQGEIEDLPSADIIRAIFNEVQNAEMAPRQDVSLAGDLIDKIPVPGLILSEEVDEDTGAYILTLSNGATVILQETANRNNEVIMYVMAKGGTINATEDTIVSVNLLSEMINVSGLGPYSRIELINVLAGKQVSFSFWLSNFYRGFQGSSTTQDINTLFEMIHLFFTNPRFDEKAIAAMLDQYRTSLAHQEENPQRFFSRELNRIINNNHPLFKPLELGDMERVSLEQSAVFLEQCINPGDYTFIFTGNINLEIMRELSAFYIASIPNSPSMNQWNNPEITRPQEGRRTIYRGVDERCLVYISWFAQAPNDFDEQKNQVAAVLSEYLDILLTDEIRENLGGVYSISSGSSVSVIPSGEYRLNVYFVCNPARSDELIEAVLKLLSDIKNEPVNADTFNKAKEALLMGHERSIQSNLHIAQSYANSSVLYDTPLNRLNLRPDAIRAVTPEDLQELARRMLRNGPVELVMFPENRE